jgi:hypothetical protein
MSELLNKEKVGRYTELLDEDWRVGRSQAVGSVEEELECFKHTILRISEEVCGLRTVGARGRKSEWGCTETAVAVREKRHSPCGYRENSKRVGKSMAGRGEMQG